MFGEFSNCHNSDTQTNLQINYCKTVLDKQKSGYAVID